MSLTMMHDLSLATGETIYMVVTSSLFAIILGLPLGTLLFTSKRLKPNNVLNRVIAAVINISRSVPFIILLVALIPLTRFLVGTSIGINAAIVPLTLGATPLFARLVENVYQSLPAGLIETSFAMGATTWQTIRLILLPEAMPSLIHAVTVTAITLVNYSAMAGTVGGGGLGDLAIRYGYQRFDLSIMLSTVFILVVLVQLIQMGGDYLARHYSHD
jgi:D-methionine transport system permease protein